MTHQRPRIAEDVWIEIIPHLVLGVDFSFACESRQRCASSNRAGSQNYVPG